jgi:hypothetical protein
LTVEKYLDLAEIEFDTFISTVQESDEYLDILSLRSVEPVTAILAILLKICGQEMLSRAGRKGKEVFFLVPSEAEDLLPILRTIPPELRIDFSWGL